MENLPANPDNIQVIIKPKPPLLKYGILILLTLVILAIITLVIYYLYPIKQPTPLSKQNQTTEKQPNKETKDSRGPEGGTLSSEQPKSLSKPVLLKTN